jgi:hypothetical protein
MNKKKEIQNGGKGMSMNQSGGLKIATILVMAILGFSTLAVGVQLSSGGSAAVTHDQTGTKSDAQGYNQTQTSDKVCESSDVIVDRAFLGSESLQVGRLAIAA